MTMKQCDVTVKPCSFSMESCGPRVEHCTVTIQCGESKIEHFDVTMEVKPVLELVGFTVAQWLDDQQ